jgi:hypothetical protein
MLSMRATGAAVVIGALIYAASAPAATAPGQFTFFGGFQAAAYCDGSGIIPSPQTLPAPDFGFAIVGAPSDGRVDATVAIRDIPGGYYTIRLIQGFADCQTIDWAGFTNAAGAVTIHLAEPAVSSTAFIAVDQYATFDGVPQEINSSFLTETYRH